MTLTTYFIELLAVRDAVMQSVIFIYKIIYIYLLLSRLLISRVQENLKILKYIVLMKFKSRNMF